MVQILVMITVLRGVTQWKLMEEVKKKLKDRK